MAPLLKLICALGFFVLATSLTEEDFSFNCNRDGANLCKNKAICDDKGKCVCANAEKGYDCSVASEAADCDPECKTTKGTCGADKKCLCKPMLYGPKCTSKAHQVMCADEKELVTKIQIPGIDKATIYIEDQPKCKQDNAAMVNPIAGFSGVASKITTDKDSDCHTTKTTVDGQAEVHCVTLVVQFNKYVTYYDYKVQFCCLSFGDANGVGVKITVGQIKPPKAELESPTPVKGDPLPGVTYQMLDKAGAVIENDAVVKVGDVVTLNFLLPKDDKRLIKILQCELSDGTKDTMTVFVENGCSLKKTIATGMKLGIDAARSFSSVTTRAVKFVNKPTVQYICLVRVCKIGDEAKCAESACDGGRRRRDIADASSNKKGTLEGQLWQFVRVASPGGLTTTTNQDNCEMGDKKMTFTATVIGFGIITVILLVIVAVLGFCILNRRRRSSNCKE